MGELFIKILNVSISTCWMILAVLCLRFALKKVPKWVRVLLWGLVALRLLCPFSIESVFSLIPSTETISPEIMLDITPTVAAGVTDIDPIVNPAIIQSSAPDPSASVDSLQVWFSAAGIVWILGITAMLLYTAVSYMRLRSKVATAVKVQDNLYRSENVVSPFVLGVFRPRIYLPFSLSEQSLSHVISHEQAHIRRKDHWWKPLGFLLLTVHWFNPLMWLAYILLCRDIELACDEKVVKDLGTEARADYSAALLSCAVSRPMIAACPIAFGEVSVKTRVKSVLSYKKPAFWVIVFALILCVVVAVCFLTNPIGSSGEPDLSFLNYENAISLVADRVEAVLVYYPIVSDETESYLNIATIPGNAVANYLDNCQWREVNAPRTTLSSSGSVEFVIADDHKITVYAQKELSIISYAKVEYQGAVRYYQIDQSDYENAVQLIYTQEQNGGWCFDITRDDVAKFRLYGPSFSGECVPVDGQTFRVGEKIWAGPLEGSTDRRDIFVSAIDKNGNILFDQSLHNYDFNATLLSIQDGYFLVEPVEGSWELNFFSTIEVPMQNMDPSLEPEIGDIISIEYDGAVWDPNITRLRNVFSITVAKKEWDVLNEHVDTLREELDKH